MKAGAFVLSVLLVMGGFKASAETPSESVTVTGTRLRKAVDKFAKAFATPTQVTGKIARWERRICPAVVGQNAHVAAFIAQHIKYVALAAGAPVDIQAACTPNIEIVFTATPQALLDNVRKTDRDYLGYATSNAQLDALARITRPIQAWYATETVDFAGARSADDGMPRGEGVRMFDPPIFVAKFTRSNGNHTNDSIHSGFSHILIVVDTTRLAGQEIVPLSDYISMLALTQIGSLDACQPLSSVVNMLAADCDHAVEGLTQFDLALSSGPLRDVRRPEGDIPAQRDRRRDGGCARQAEVGQSRVVRRELAKPGTFTRAVNLLYSCRSCDASQRNRGAYPRPLYRVDSIFMANPQDAHVVKLLRLACEIADAQGASLFLVNGEVLQPYVIYNLPKEYIAGIGEVRVGSQCCGRAVEARKPWVVTDMLEDPLFAEGRDGAAHSPIRAAFSVPVFQGDAVIASLACHYTAPHVPSAVDIDRNEHFARLIAIMLKSRGAMTPPAPIFVIPTDELPVTELQTA